MTRQLAGFVDAVTEWGGTACDCPVSIAVSLSGEARASVPAAVTSAPGGTARAIAGRTGDASAVAIALDGDARATARSGTGGGAATPLPAGSDHRSSLDRSDVDRVVADLAEGMASADPSAEPLHVSRSLPAPAGAAPVSVDVAVSGGDRCSATDACSIAVAVSAAGTAAAQVTPASACSASGGTPAAVAVSVTGRAVAESLPSDSRSCAATGADTGLVVASAGDSGTAIGLALAGSGAAAADASSGDLGVVTSRATGTPSRTGVVASSGSSGDAASIAVGRHAASADVATGDTGDAAAVCAACASAADGSTRAVSGDTGDGFSLAGSGKIAAADSRSGATGDVTSTATGRAPEPGTVQDVGYHGGIVTGRSGDTGNAYAGAVDPRHDVEVDTRTGVSGYVTSTTVPPGDPGDTAGDGPGTAPGVDVGESGSGSITVHTGEHRRSETVPSQSGRHHSSRNRTDAVIRSHQQPELSTTTPTRAHRPSPGVTLAPAVANDRNLLDPRAKPISSAEQSAGNDRERRMPLAERRSTAAAVGITSGAAFFALAALLAVAVRLRRRRSRR